MEQHREILAAYLRAWARHGVAFGLPSWQLPLWDDAEEDRARLFGTACLEIDAGRLPAPGLLERMAAVAPGVGLACALRGGPMTCRFSYAAPRGEERGERNRRFLDAALLCETVLPRLAPLRARTRVVLLCLDPIYATEGLSFSCFLHALEPFLAALPASYRYALEIRNPEYLLPDYFACLRAHGVAHVFSEAGMPPLLDQVQRPGAVTAELMVCRSSPEAGGMSSERLLGMAELVRRCVGEQRTGLFYLDETWSMSALGSLMTVLDGDLAKLSPLRKQAA